MSGIGYYPLDSQYMASPTKKVLNFAYLTDVSIECIVGYSISNLIVKINIHEKFFFILSEN